MLADAPQLPEQLLKMLADALDEYRIGDLASWAGPGLWLGAGLAAALRDIPLIWNAPGVPHPFARGFRPVVDSALEAADYVSVRDTGSAELLAAPREIDVRIVPDTIAELARMWPVSFLPPKTARSLPGTAAVAATLS